MSKEEEAAERAMEHMRETAPSMIKCSYNTGRRIQGKMSGAPMTVISDFSRMKIVMSDQIPDHIILMCDKDGSVLRLVNLKKPESMINISGVGSQKTH